MDAKLRLGTMEGDTMRAIRSDATPLHIVKKWYDYYLSNHATFNEVANAFGVNATTVRKNFKKHGFEIRTRQKACAIRDEKRGFRPTNQVIKKVAMLKRAGYTLAQIGAELGISRQRVHQLTYGKGDAYKRWLKRKLIKDA